MSEIKSGNCGIYRIVNIENGKFYIGSSKQIARRFYLHKWSLKRGDHHSVTLQRAWNSHGQEAFRFEIVRLCSEEDRLSVEQRLLDALRPHDPEVGYNISFEATYPSHVEWSDERRKRASEAKLGKPIFKNNPEAMARLIANARRGEDHHQFGKPVKEHVRTILINARRGKAPWNKGKESPTKGTKRPEIIGKRISEAKRNGPPPKNSKLNAEKVREIRRLHASAELSKNAIANMFGVDASTISLVISRKRWAHIG